MNYYSGQEGAPYHLSIGAVVINDRKEAYCRHHSSNEHDVPGELYLLMRETMEPGETIEQTLMRGCQEELGLEISVKEFLGALISHYGYADKEVEKTTLYFLCGAEREIEEALEGWEATGRRALKPLPFLIRQSKRQAEHFQRDDYDESAILERGLSSFRKIRRPKAPKSRLVNAAGA